MEAQIKFHKKHGKILTMTSAQPEGRFGALSTENDGKVVEFTEKPKGDGSWINAGYFICKQEIFDYIGDKNDIVFEEAPLTSLAEKGELYTYRHNGFWLPMDTLRDKLKLDQMYQSNNAPWKIWS